MNFARRQRSAAGLDIGQTATRLVLLDGDGRAPRVRAALLRHRDEGIIGDTELGEHLATWLGEHGYRGDETIVNLPQYLATAQLRDFPESTQQELEALVAQETQQLAGLSDEAFLHGYRRLPAFAEHRNPALIGACREAVARERLDLAGAAAVNLVDLAMEGEALAATWRAVCRDTPPAGEQVLLLDIGSENTTLAVLEQGHIVYLGSILFGGDFFTEALARHLGVTEAEADRIKRSSRVILSDDTSPLTRGAQQLVNELLTTLDNWRYQAKGDQAPPLKVWRIYLSGGGSLLPGLGDYLHDTFTCPVHSLRPPGLPDDPTSAELAIAYGLALQAWRHGRDAFTVSLAPPDLRWAVQRRRRAPALAVALVLLAAILGAQVWTTWRLTGHDSQRLQLELHSLEQCRDLAPRIKNEADQILSLERMLMPFAARGNRGHRFLAAIAALDTHRHSEDAIVLVADEDSYFAKPATGVATTTGPRDELAGLFGAAPARPSGRTGVILGGELRPWSALYASGFTPQRERDPLRTVSATILALNKDAGGIFRGVDIMSDAELSSLNFEVRREWQEGLTMKPFTLKLPLANPEFEAEAPR